MSKNAAESLASSLHKSSTESGLSTPPAPNEQTSLLPAIPTVNTYDSTVTPEQRQDDEEEPLRPTTSHSLEAHTSANQTLGYARGTLVVLALGVLIFIQATNISMLTTTQSSIASDLDAFEKTSWFTSAYLIAMSALGPLNGKLSSVFSPRIIIFVASIVLAIGAFITGSARGFEEFIVGRVVTGIGASGVFTVSIIIVLEITGSKRRGLGIGMLNSGYTVGVAAGATAAGALLPLIGWRWLFWVQIPMTLFSGMILLLAIPESFTAGKKQDESLSTWTLISRLDYTGAVTLTTTLVLLLYALSAPRQIPLLPLFLSAVVAVCFVLNEVYLASDPIIPIYLLRHRGLLLTCLGTVGFMMARWSVLFYAPTYALAVRTWAPSAAGAMLIPTNAGFAMGGLLVGWLHVKRAGSFYVPTLIVYGLFPFTFVALALLCKHSSPAWLFITIIFVGGFVTGAALNYGLAHLLHITPKESHYVATALVATFRGFAGSFGSAIGGGIFTRTLATSLTQRFADLGIKDPDLVRRLLGSPALVGSLEEPKRTVAIEGYEDGLRTLWLWMAVVALAMFFVQAGTGWEGDERKRRRKAREVGIAEERRGLVSGEDEEER